MKNKKTIMAISALMILVFHFYINIFNLEIENFIKYLCFIGVDLFFFVSSYSIGYKNSNYKDFIKNRFSNIYLEFIILSILYILVSNKSILNLISIITGLDFINRGGGSFLWFIPCIMLVYIILPIYKKYDNIKLFISSFIIYLIISLLILISGNNQLLIFINRIPIIMIGYYMGKSNIIEYIDNKRYLIISILLFIFGIISLYIAYYSRLSNDLNYLISIPFSIGTIMLLDKVSTNKIFNFIGSITLELYGIQMIYGFRLANYMIKIINNSFIVNILVFSILIIIAFIFNYLFKMFKKYSFR